MSTAQLVITVVVLEGRSKTEVARDYDLSRQWVHQLVSRYKANGSAAFQPRSRCPHTNPRATITELEERIVRLRKTLDKAGYDAGAATIAEHLARDPDATNLPAFYDLAHPVPPRLHRAPTAERPRSVWKRFTAAQPNELWQADVTHWQLADGTEAEILNILDDHPGLALTSLADPPSPARTWSTRSSPRSPPWGTPAAVLTDNGAIFTATPRRGGRTALQVALGELDIKYINSRPYHPQTCGKVERFRQTFKKRLAALPPGRSIPELQTRLDDFLAYCNTIRPHRTLRRRTPATRSTIAVTLFPGHAKSAVFRWPRMTCIDAQVVH